jgi:hypothetical protein
MKGSITAKIANRELVCPCRLSYALPPGYKNDEGILSVHEGVPESFPEPKGVPAKTSAD